jgi:hypothetical protein
MLLRDKDNRQAQKAIETSSCTKNKYPSTGTVRPDSHRQSHSDVGEVAALARRLKCHVR